MTTAEDAHVDLPGAYPLDTTLLDDDSPVQHILHSRPSQPEGHCSEQLFSNTAPQPYRGHQKKRAVLCNWPRDPNGAVLDAEKPKGTLSPDGYPWGERLDDFVNVSRVPNAPWITSIMTRSAICEAVEALGEVDIVASEINLAKLEGRPKVKRVVDTGRMIRDHDSRLRARRAKVAPSQDKKAVQKQNGDQNESDKVSESDIEHDNTISTFPPIPTSTIPATSLFSLGHDPSPEPFIPFRTPSPSILLQERIPLYLLPRKLYVHDPFCLRHARERQFHDTLWTSRPDIVRTYSLHISGSVRSQAEEARRKAEELEEFKARTLILLRYKRTKEQIKNHEPIIEVPLPPSPRRMTKVEESHLYLSPVAKVGKGHHSLVYRGEWVLPLDLFTKERTCQFCLKESADQEIQRLKDTGRWDKMLGAASWGPNGFTGRLPTQAELDAVNDPTNLARDGEDIEREITCIVPPHVAPSEILELLDEANVWDTLMKNRSVNAMQVQWAGYMPDDAESDVAVMRINPPLSRESQNSCRHRAYTSHAPHSRMVILSVIAKLSLEDDDQLANEGDNYQHFPEHFFRHYSGYNLIDQLHAVVPVNAVVPQFYGFYTPDSEEDKELLYPPYISPILLLEHCGKPINPPNLFVEEQEECASLLLRFQRAGWLHESVARRNFLVQRGVFSLVQELTMPSFRLIDFGRSRKYVEAYEKAEEEKAALRMLDKLGGKMSITCGLNFATAMMY